VDIHVIQDAPDLLVSIMTIKIIRQIHLLFLDSADETLRVAVLPGLALIGHADMKFSILQDLSVGRGCVLDSIANPKLRVIGITSLITMRN
jgi:hypothetical protein